MPDNLPQWAEGLRLGEGWKSTGGGEIQLNSPNWEYFEVFPFGGSGAILEAHDSGDQIWLGFPSPQAAIDAAETLVRLMRGEQ